MKTVLVVEDEPELRELEEGILKREYAVLTAATGEEALESIAKQKPDILLLDIMLPNMSGFEVCQKLRGDPSTASIPIVMLTGQDKAEALSEGFEAGADMYINKPFSAKKLLAVVRAMLEKKVD